METIEELKERITPFVLEVLQNTLPNYGEKQNRLKEMWTEADTEKVINHVFYHSTDVREERTVICSAIGSIINNYVIELDRQERMSNQQKTLVNIQMAFDKLIADCQCNPFFVAFANREWLQYRDQLSDMILRKFDLQTLPSAKEVEKYVTSVVDQMKQRYCTIYKDPVRYQYDNFSHVELSPLAKSVSASYQRNHTSLKDDAERYVELVRDSVRETILSYDAGCGTHTLFEIVWQINKKLYDLKQLKEFERFYYQIHADEDNDLVIDLFDPFNMIPKEDKRITTASDLYECEDEDEDADDDIFNDIPQDDEATPCKRRRRFRRPTLPSDADSIDERFCKLLQVLKFFKDHGWSAVTPSVLIRLLDYHPNITNATLSLASRHGYIDRFNEMECSKTHRGTFGSIYGIAESGERLIKDQEMSDVSFGQLFQRIIGACDQDLQDKLHELINGTEDVIEYHASSHRVSRLTGLWLANYYGGFQKEEPRYTLKLTPFGKWFKEQIKKEREVVNEG